MSLTNKTNSIPACTGPCGSFICHCHTQLLYYILSTFAVKQKIEKLLIIFRLDNAVLMEVSQRSPLMVVDIEAPLMVRPTTQE